MFSSLFSLYISFHSCYFFLLLSLWLFTCHFSWSVRVPSTKLDKKNIFIIKDTQIDLAVSDIFLYRLTNLLSVTFFHIFLVQTYCLHSNLLLLLFYQFINYYLKGQNIRRIGSSQETDFFTFSQKLLIGYLGQVSNLIIGPQGQKIGPIGLEPPARARIKRKATVNIQRNPSPEFIRLDPKNTVTH